jgi:hypothetical protein
MIMQLALRPYAVAAGVALIGAGLIQVTPVVAPHVERRGVDLAAVESLSDVLPSLSDLSGPLADGASSQAALELLDPAFWQLFFYDLSNPDSGDAAGLLLTGAVEQLPVIGPILWSFAGLVVLPVTLL